MVRGGQWGAWGGGAERIHYVQAQDSGKWGPWGAGRRNQDQQSSCNFGGCAVRVVVQISRARTLVRALSMGLPGGEGWPWSRVLTVGASVG